MKEVANLSWSDSWPVVLDEKSWCGEYIGGAQLPCFLTEKGVKCLLSAGKGSRHWLWRQLWPPSGSGISLLFSASPLLCCSNSAPAFSCPHLSEAPSPNSWSPVIGGCLLQGRLGLWLCGSWGESKAREKNGNRPKNGE